MSSTGESSSEVVYKGSSIRSSPTLPIWRYHDEILYALERYSVLIMIGETGSGKSTQLPQILYKNGWTSNGQAIVCTQPRRMACITLSKRVSEEMSVVLGEEVGYGVRFESECNKNDKRTSIKYMTDGLLMRETMTDPLLSSYSVVIVDEAHERSLHSDVLLGLLKKILRKRQSDFRIIITSASMNTTSLQEFFDIKDNGNGIGDSNVRVMNMKGRPYTVDMCYLKAACANYVTEAVNLILSIHESESDHNDNNSDDDDIRHFNGNNEQLHKQSILCFLPGQEEIDVAMTLLEENCQREDIYFLPLYAHLSRYKQMRVFESQLNCRKVILATNIAETSITIPDIKYVIDSGYERVSYFDVHSGVESLVTTLISKASALQRCGRAGRTQSGKCFRLMTENFYKAHLPDYSIPDMQRSEITWIVLQLKAIGIEDILHFDFLSPPPVDSMIYALELLYALGALDEKCALTKAGKMMASMPLNPRMSKCLIKSLEMQCGNEMLNIASMCSVDYPFIEMRSNKIPSEEQREVEANQKELFAVEGDHLTLLNVYNKAFENGFDTEWCNKYGLSAKTLRHAHKVRTDLYRLLRNYEKTAGFKIETCDNDMDKVRRCLVTGYFANVAKLHSNGKYQTIRGQVTVLPHSRSMIGRYTQLPEWILYNEIVHTNMKEEVITLREVSKLHPRWLMEYASHYYSLAENV